MRRLITLALLGLFWATLSTPASATVAGGGSSLSGHAFCKDGMHGTRELADRLQQALTSDPTGMKVPLKHCYATPNDFLLAFQQADDKAGLTSVSQLVGYVLKLKEMEVDHTIEYKTSCIRDDGGVHEVIMGCATRKLGAHEKTYGNPETGARGVLLENCVNPGFSPWTPVLVTVPKCAEVRFTVTSEHEAHVLIVGPDVTETECAPAILGYADDGYHAEWKMGDSGARSPYGCNFRQILDYTGWRPERSMCFRVSTGVYRIRLPARFAKPGSPNRVVLCIGNSDGVGVPPEAYRKEDIFRAWVIHSAAESPDAPPTALHFTWGAEPDPSARRH